jgi:hypothetical protein
MFTCEKLFQPPETIWNPLDNVQIYLIQIGIENESPAKISSALKSH